MSGDLQHGPGSPVNESTVHEPTGKAGVSITMNGRGRPMDNVFVERLWWSVKYEHVYRHDHLTVASLHEAANTYLEFFNRQRRHQSLEYATPWEVYRGKWRWLGQSRAFERPVEGRHVWWQWLRSGSLRHCHHTQIWESGCRQSL